MVFFRERCRRFWGRGWLSLCVVVFVLVVVRVNAVLYGGSIFFIWLTVGAVMWGAIFLCPVHGSFSCELRSHTVVFIFSGCRIE